MKKYYIIGISVIFFGCVSFGLYFYTRNGAIERGKIVDKELKLPETTFDAEATVPSTTISFLYPKNGFYGTGANIDVNENKVTISPTKPYDSEKGIEFVVLRVNYIIQNQNLKQYLDSYDPQSVDKQYMATGKYEIVNGQNYFLYKVAEDATVWNAYTEYKGKIIWVSLAYKPSDGDESTAAYINNDKLFENLLTHFSFR